jgi:hypothetical protein
MIRSPATVSPIVYGHLIIVDMEDLGLAWPGDAVDPISNLVSRASIASDCCVFRASVTYADC